MHERLPSFRRSSRSACRWRLPWRLGGYAVARRALAPVERMTERARSITAERLSDRLPVHNPTTRWGAWRRLHETLARLEQFRADSRVTTDVSHELRTPLTAIRSVGEVGLRGHRDETATAASSAACWKKPIAWPVSSTAAGASRAERAGELSREVVDSARPGIRRRRASGGGEEKRQAIMGRARGRAAGTADRLVLRRRSSTSWTMPSSSRRLVDRSRFASRRLLTRRFDVIDSARDPPEARARIFDRFYRVDGTDTGARAGLRSPKSGRSQRRTLTLEDTGPGKHLQDYDALATLEDQKRR